MLRPWTQMQLPLLQQFRCRRYLNRNIAIAPGATTRLHLYTLRQHLTPAPISTYSSAFLRIFDLSKWFPYPSTRNSSSNNIGNCWKCTNPLPKEESVSFPPKCPKCSALQKTSPGSNYFKILGLPLKYKLDDGALSDSMKTLQKQLHPDLFSSKSKEEREISQFLSSVVNQGVKTLQNPIDRGLYILQLQGLDADMEKQLTLDKEFLMEVMELNEMLEGLSSPKAWKSFRSKNNQVLANLEQKLETAFESQNYEKAQLILSKMKYFENLQNKLKEVQGKFGVVD